MNEACQKIAQIGEQIASCIALVDIPVCIIQQSDGSPQSQAFHQSVKLADLVIRKPGNQVRESHSQAHQLSSVHMKCDFIQRECNTHIQNDIKRHHPSDMMAQQEELKPCCQIEHETKACASHRKYEFKERLLPVTGPQIEIIHIEPLKLYAAVNEKTGSQKQGKYQKAFLSFVKFFGDPVTYFHFLIPLLLLSRPVFLREFFQAFLCLFPCPGLRTKGGQRISVFV